MLGVFAGLAMMSGVAMAALLVTGPGHRALRNLLLDRLGKAVDGTVQIGEVTGALWRAADLHDVVFRDRAGKPVIQLDRARVTYGITDLLRGRIRFSGVTLVHPVVTLEQQEDRHWNIEHLFRTKDKPPNQPPSRRPLVELRDVVLTDGTLIVRELPPGKHTFHQRTLTGLNATFSRLRPSHPDSTAIEGRFRRLSVKMDDPAIDIRDARGFASLDGDSVKFVLDRIALPNSEAVMSGLVRWDRNRTSVTADIDAGRFTFADARGVVPMLPAEGGGRASLLVTLPGDNSGVVDIRDADVRIGRSYLLGKGTVTVGRRGGVSVRGVDMALRPLDLALLAPYVDSLPARGLVRGTVRGSGSLTNVTFAANLAWDDESVEGAPTNTVDARGRLSLGGREELVFHGVTVHRADFDLNTIHRFAPSIALAGRLRASGTLDGPWKDAQFHGTLYHDGEGDEQSVVRGDLRLGLRDTTHIDAELQVGTLSFALLRRTYPQIPLREPMSGTASIHGPITGLNIGLSLRGTTGTLTATGTVGVRDSVVRVAASGLFDSLDLEQVNPAAPPSALWGRWTANLQVPEDTASPSTGTARVDIQRGRLAGVAVGAGGTQVRLEPGRIEVEYARLAFSGGTINSSGAVGRGAGAASRLAFELRADTVGYLEPLLRWARRESGDSSTVKLDGSGVVTGSIAGTTTAWRLDADAAVSAMDLGSTLGRNLRARGVLARDSSGYAMSLDGSADTLAAAGLVYSPVGLAVSGRPESLTIRANAGFLSRSAVRAAFTLWTDTDRHIKADSLEVDLPVHRWRLLRPAAAIIAKDVIRLDTVELRSDEGVGYLRASGALPRSGLADFSLVADSVSLSDVYAVLQKDTSGISGAINAQGSVTGPARAPIIDLRAALSEGRFGDYRLPLFQVLTHYEQQRLTIKGGLWRDSLRLVAVNGSLPVDLSLEPVARRKLPGTLEVVARSDSLDMQVLDPLIDVVTGLSGRMALDVRAQGTWDSPEYEGYVDIAGGRMTVPSLGASYQGIDARLSLQHNVMSVSRMQLGGGNGVLDVGGTITFDSAFSARPRLDLALNFNRFRAINIAEFGGFTGTGQFQLTGPLLGATLTGNAVIDEGYLQFADLVQKRVVSLDDPEFRAMVDSSLTQADLAPAAHVIFFDSLRVEGVRLTMGPDVWLRSSEANIQLDGEFVVDRTIEDQLARYRIDGTLHAVRGTYKLVLGLENSLFSITRDFRVTRGTVRFFGTPDFNPEMDIAAEHQARTVQGQPLTVRVLIGGTLLYPTLQLESDARPPLTQTELISYLMFGVPPSSTGGNESQLGLTAVGGSFVTGVGQALASELGLPLSYLTIQTGAGHVAGTPAGTSSARIEAGAQLTDKAFLTLNAGLCEVQTSSLLGASLEYRLTNRWTASAAFEPVVQQCGTARNLAGLNSRFQFGFDLFWQSGIR